MANVEDILKSMLVEMKKYEEEYNKIPAEINTIVEEYTAKIDALQKQRLALQEEGNKKIDVLQARREQLSGKHSSLYEQYKKFAGKEPDFSELEVKVEKPEEVSKPKTELKTTSKKSSKETKKDETMNEDINKADAEPDALSPDEIAKLDAIAGVVTKNETTTDKNGNEIPDYLKDEYSK